MLVSLRFQTSYPRIGHYCFFYFVKNNSDDTRTKLIVNRTKKEEHCDLTENAYICQVK